MASKQITNIAVGTQITFKIAGQYVAGEVGCVEPICWPYHDYTGEQAITVYVPGGELEIRGGIVRTCTA